MRRFSFSNLHMRLILMVLLAIIPALGITLYSGLEYRESARHKALNDAFLLAQKISKDHDRLIQSTRQVLFTLSQMPQVQQQDKAACCRIFSNLMKQFEVTLHFLPVSQMAMYLPVTNPLPDRSILPTGRGSSVF